jgi:hypothetical protein
MCSVRAIKTRKKNTLLEHSMRQRRFKDTYTYDIKSLGAVATLMHSMFGKPQNASKVYRTAQTPVLCDPVRCCVPWEEMPLHCNAGAVNLLCML